MIWATTWIIICPISSNKVLINKRKTSEYHEVYFYHSYELILPSSFLNGQKKFWQGPYKYKIHELLKLIWCGQEVRCDAKGLTTFECLPFLTTSQQNPYLGSLNIVPGTALLLYPITAATAILIYLIYLKS